MMKASGAAPISTCCDLIPGEILISIAIRAPGIRPASIFGHEAPTEPMEAKERMRMWGIGEPMSGKLQAPSSKRQGFTLLELMVVVVLIGIMTAAILPEMKGSYED